MEPPTDALAAWRATVAASPQAPLLHVVDATISVAELDATSDALAAALADRGLSHGDRVAVMLQNDPQWPLVLLAAWKLGAIAVALNPMFKHRELTYHLQDCGATVLVCLEHLWHEVAAGVVEHTQVAVVLTTDPGGWRPADARRRVRGPACRL